MMVDSVRRAFVFGAPLFLAGCAASGRGPYADRPAPIAEPGGGYGGVDPHYQAMYAAIDDDRYPVPAIDLRRIDPRFYRQQVPNPTGQPAGTVVVDPDAHFLYLVGGDGMAMRYGVGVGREGFGWHGTATIKRKAAWPTWTPPSDMVARDPKAAKYAGGMPGGPGNPLGARALYLYQGNRDTLFRLHGTIEPESIGKSMSSGCIRLLNQDIIDLYNRVPAGTRVVVTGSHGQDGDTPSYAQAPADEQDPGVDYAPGPYEPDDPQG